MYDPEFEPKQPTRLLPESITALKHYMRYVRRTTGRRTSVNAAINALIIIGAETATKKSEATK